jgi:hypothetical protein
MMDLQTIVNVKNTWLGENMSRKQANISAFHDVQGALHWNKSKEFTI